MEGDSVSILRPKLYFFYLLKLYIKNLLSILFGLSFAFAAIDYFQHIQQFNISGNYKILYIFYMWQEALGLLYPLSIVFALIMTKLSLVKNNTMGILHAFGYNKKRLISPFLLAGLLTYGIFFMLQTTEFSYAKDKAMSLLNNKPNSYSVNDLFFKYNDTFVYIKRLNPAQKKLIDITIFKVENYKVIYTISAPFATFDGNEWDAHHAILKTHIYKNNELYRYSVVKKEIIKTLTGYKPKIIESLYEGKSLNLVDAYVTWILLHTQHLNTDKIRAYVYNKTVVPLFSLALVIILFFKLPFHARMMNIGSIIALALGNTFFVWGILFGLNQIGANGVLMPELTAILPIVLLWSYALYVYFMDEKII
jgi:lipopolysaccharide export system permease protein